MPELCFEVRARGGFEQDLSRCDSIDGIRTRRPRTKGVGRPQSLSSCLVWFATSSVADGRSARGAAFHYRCDEAGAPAATRAPWLAQGKNRARLFVDQRVRDAVLLGVRSFAIGRISSRAKLGARSRIVLGLGAVGWGLDRRSRQTSWMQSAALRRPALLSDQWERVRSRQPARAPPDMQGSGGSITSVINDPGFL